MKRSLDSDLEEGEEIEDDVNIAGADINNADAWDDTALIEAWDMAKAEYLKFHSLESQEKKADIASKIQEKKAVVASKKQKIIEDEPISSQTIIDPIIDKVEMVKDDEPINNKKDDFVPDTQIDSAESKKSNDTLQTPISTDQLNALMAWYWAGYYTAKLSK